MNWDALGAIAEALGALGVILTLLYLVTQIKQNTKALKVATYSTNRKSLNETSHLVASNNDVLRVMHLALHNRESEFSEEDETRFSFFVTSMLRTWEESYFLKNENLIDDQAWNRIETSLKRVVSLNYFKRYWQSQEFSFDERFTVYVDALMEESA